MSPKPSMKLKPPRPLLLGALALVALLAVAVVVAFSSGFQTWVLRRLIASRPGLRAEVGEASVGLNRVELKNLRYEQGGAVLMVPAVMIDLPVVTAGWDRRIAVSRLVAHGWTLDLSAAEKNSGAPPVPANTAKSGPIPARAVQAFAGIFGQLTTPCDVAIDGVELVGEVILPESRGRVKVTLLGGGLGAAREGNFNLVATAALGGAGVRTVEMRGRLVAAMDTPRTFARLGAVLDAVARGDAFAGEIALHADATATRGATGETYALAVATAGREILGVTAEFPRDTEKFSGAWKLDVHDGDVAPFALGKPLPTFVAAGQGAMEIDAGFSGFQISGELAATADRLQTLRPEFAPLGALKLSTGFDLAGRDGLVAVRKFEAKLSAAQPVATLRALQPFEFRPATGAMDAAEPARDVFGLVLQGVPIAWLQPYAKTLELRGGQIRGEFAASPRNGGMTLRSLTPFMLDELNLASAGQPWLERVSLTLNTAIDYTPQGWQAEILDGAVRRDGAALLTIEGRAGQLAGRDQPVKVTGRLLAQVAGWAAQPLVAGRLALTGGEALVNFTASLNPKTEFQATLGLKNLVAHSEAGAVKLPSLACDLRADVSADGRIAFSAPLAIERDGRKSDLVVNGSIEPEREKSRGLDAQITGTSLVLDDGVIFAAAFASPPGDRKAAPSPPASPPWAGLHGSVSLRLDNLIYSDSLRATQVRGKLRLDAGMVKLEGLQAGLGSGGRANLKGALTFDAAAPQIYTAQVDVAVKEFDPSPLWRLLNRDQPAIIEGKFDARSKLSAAAPRLALLGDTATGELQITSRGGQFRGFPVAVSTTVESPGRIATILASAGSVFGGRAPKKDPAEIASRAEAVGELVRGWNPIAYDQLSVVLTRDGSANTVLKDFTLISPELRLAGSGATRHGPGRRLLDEVLTMEFRLRARGRQGELLKYLGVLETEPDELGYAGCTMPLRVTGTLAQPDPSELNTKLAALALEKGGLVDRAAELFNKLRGAAK